MRQVSNMGKKLDMIMSTVSKLSPIPGRVNEVGYIIKYGGAHMYLNLEHMYACIIVCSSSLRFCKTRFVNMNHTDNILLAVAILSIMKYYLLCTVLY